MLRYFVRTTEERALDESFSQIEYELWIDKEHKPMKSLISLLETINDYDAVILEDDVILCENFKEEIEKAISKYPNQIINFFNAPTIYQDIITNKNFCFMQCRYYPKGTAKLIANQLVDYLNDKKVCPRLNAVMKSQDINIVQYRPCLVQHLDMDSLVENSPHSRRTPYFIDYLKELDITYGDARDEEIQKKLFELMREKFKDIDNKKDPN